MKLIAHNVKNPKYGEGGTEQYYDPDVLNKYDLEYLERAGYKEVWYWYVSSSYDGDGQVLGLNIEGRWNWENLGHCSCYSPAEDADAMRNSYATLDELTEGYTPERLAEIQMLLDAIKESQS